MGRSSSSAVLLAWLPIAALAQAPGNSPARASTQTAPPEEITVIGTAPAGGSVPRDEVPGASRVLDSDDIKNSGRASVLDALDTRVGGVSLNEAQGNPWQPSLLFRGFEASPLAGNGRAFFQNVGKTRRQGIEAGAELRGQRWSAFLDYAFLDARFRTPLTLNSPENPAASPDGTINVSRGDHLPGIPAHSLKFGASVTITESWQIGLTGRAASGKYLFGDEANLTGKTKSYAVLNLNTAYDVTPNLQLFAIVNNVLNKEYETFGTFSPTSSVPITQAPAASNPRSLSPGAPRAVYVGARLRLP
jgi:outer membrane cobalamin receptor